MSKDALRILKVIGIAAAAVALAIALLIYVGVITGSAIRETPSDTASPDIPLNDDEQAVPGTTTVKLYFRYGSMLAYETREIQTYANQLVEQVALKELLRGPLSEGSNLERVIDPQTTTVSVTAQGDTLFVTLSSEFLRQSSNLPEGWGEDSSLREEEYLRKRLAVYSVVNTLTGIGNYSHVQLLVDVDNTGVGERVTYGKLGFMDETSKINSLLEPMAFTQEVTLNAQNTVKAILSSIQSGDYSTAFSFLAPKTASGISRPLYDSVATNLKKLVTQVESFAIVGEDYAYDGSSALVWVDITYKTPDGQTLREKSCSFKLRLVNQLWMMDHDQLYRVFSGE